MGLRDRYLERQGEEKGPPSLFEQVTDTLNPATWGPALAEFGVGVGGDLRRLGETATTLPVLAGSRVLGMDTEDMAARVADNPVLRQFIAEETLRPVAANGDWRDEFTARGHQLIPNLTGVASSIESTPGRIVQQAASLAPGGIGPGETEYGLASKEGRIIPLLVEDVGNVALVAGGTSQALGRAGQAVAPGSVAAERLAAVGRPIAKVADVADQISDPSRVWGAPARGAGAVIRKAGDVTNTPALTSVGDMLNTQGVIRPAWQAATATRKGPLGRVAAVGDELMVSRRTRPLHQSLAANDQTMHAQTVQTIKPLMDAAPDKTVAGAGVLLDMGQLEALAPALPHLSDVQLAEHLRAATPIDVTADQVTMARQVLDGTIDPETLTQIDQARTVFDTALRQPLTERLLTGADDAVPISSDQILHRKESAESDTYLTLAETKKTAEVDQQIAEAKAKVDELTARIDELEQNPLSDTHLNDAHMTVAAADLTDATRRATDLETNRDSAIAQALKADPNSAPSRYRPAILASRHVAESLTEQAEKIAATDPATAKILTDAAAAIPTDLEAIVKAGIEPRYVPGGSVLEGAIDLSVEVPDDLGPALGVDDPTVALKAAERVRTAESEMQAAVDHGDPMDQAAAQMALDRATTDLADAGVADLEAFDAATFAYMRQTGKGRIHIDQGVSVEAPERIAPGGKVTYRQRGQNPEGVTLGQTRLKESGATPLTFEGQAKLAARRIAQAARNREQRWMVEHVALTGQDLGVSHLGGDDAVDAANQAARATTGEKVQAFSTNPEHAGPIATDKITPDMLASGEVVFLPEYAAKAYNARWGEPGTWERFAEAAIDKPMEYFKMGALAFNPRWQLGNAVGGMILSTFAGGVGPLEIMTHAKAGMEMAKRAMNDPASLSDVEARMFTSHPERDVGAFARTGEIAPERGRVRRASDWSFEKNELIDNFYKSTVYNAKRSAGYSDAHAVELALRALPDFRNRWWENRVLKRFLPFWPWMREVTKISYRLGRDHPFRVAWAMRLGDMYASQTETDEIDWLQGAVQTGDERFMMLGGLNPFGDIPALSPLDVGRNLNPVLKLGVAATTGFDLTDNRYLTRPPGTGGTTALGAESGRPLLTDPSALAYQALGIVPQLRAVRDVTLAPVERYESGDPIRPAERIPGTNRYRREEVDSPGSRFAPLLNLTGLPFPQDVDVDTMLRIKREREAQAARARRAYQAG